MYVHAVALGSGLLFALGLGLAGMTVPENVIGFLDVMGAWDPSLAAVMASAIAVYATAHAVGRRMRKPVLALSFSALARGTIDLRLLFGSALFGIGWGLAGYCPGPALVSSVTGAAPVLAFTATMLIGAWITRHLDGRRDQR